MEAWAKADMDDKPFPEVMPFEASGPYMIAENDDGVSSVKVKVAPASSSSAVLSPTAASFVMTAPDDESAKLKPADAGPGWIDTCNDVDLLARRLSRIEQAVANRQDGHAEDEVWASSVHECPDLRARISSLEQGYSSPSDQAIEDITPDDQAIEDITPDVEDENPADSTPVWVESSENWKKSHSAGYAVDKNGNVVRLDVGTHCSKRVECTLGTAHEGECNAPPKSVPDGSNERAARASRTAARRTQKRADAQAESAVMAMYTSTALVACLLDGTAFNLNTPEPPHDLYVGIAGFSPYEQSLVGVHAVTSVNGPRSPKYLDSSSGVAVPEADSSNFVCKLVDDAGETLYTQCDGLAFEVDGSNAVHEADFFTGMSTVQGHIYSIGAAKAMRDPLDSKYGESWHEPQGERQYELSPQRSLWRTAKEVKFQAYKDRNLFELVRLDSLPKGTVIHPSLWVHAIKRDGDGKFLKLNPRWCICGGRMSREIYKSFSDVMRSSSMCMIVSVGMTYMEYLFRFQMDESDAFQSMLLEPACGVKGALRL